VAGNKLHRFRLNVLHVNAWQLRYNTSWYLSKISESVATPDKLALSRTEVKGTIAESVQESIHKRDTGNHLGRQTVYASLGCSTSRDFETSVSLARRKRFGHTAFDSLFSGEKPSELHSKILP